MHYNVIKKQYKIDVALIYLDTDSFRLKCNGIDLFDEVAKGPLAKFRDLSNCDINHASYNVANKDKLGLLKSETGSIPMQETICLKLKCYSALLYNDSCKSTAKGVHRSSYKNQKYSLFNDILTTIMNDISVNCTNIRRFKKTSNTLQTRKRALSKLDRTRWRVNPELSLGFGHPDIPLRLSCEIPRNFRRERKQILDDLDTNLPYNRTKR